MVCEKCEKKLTAVIVPDKWKTGANNTIGKVKAGKTNRVLNKLSTQSQWIPSNSCCRLCKTKVGHKMHYCNDCAHKKGICTMCGVKAIDISAHKMSLT